MPIKYTKPSYTEDNLKGDSRLAGKMIRRMAYE